MSQARQLNQKFKLREMEEAALKLGMSVLKNANTRGWNGRNMGTRPLVVKGDAGYDLGFSKDGMVHDAHGGHTEKILETLMPAYVGECVQEHGHEIIETTNTAEEIVITVGRGY